MCKKINHVGFFCFCFVYSQTVFFFLSLIKCNLDNGARCTETSVSITYISCLLLFFLFVLKLVRKGGFSRA